MHFLYFVWYVCMYGYGNVLCSVYNLNTSQEKNKNALVALIWLIVLYIIWICVHVLYYSLFGERYFQTIFFFFFWQVNVKHCMIIINAMKCDTQAYNLWTLLRIFFACFLFLIFFFKQFKWIFDQRQWIKLLLYSPMIWVHSLSL